MTPTLGIAMTRRLGLLSTAGLLILGSAWFWKRYYVVHDAGAGPAGPPVAAAPFQRTWRDGPVVLLGLGDSVTEGYGSTPGHSFFERLAVAPPDEAGDMMGRNLRAVFPRMTVLNKAVCGTTSSAVVENELIRLRPFPADTLGVVVVSTGGNDLIHNYGRTAPQAEAMYGATRAQAGPWVADYARRLEGMVARLEELFPGGAEIFMLSIFDPTDGVGDISHAELPDWPEGLAILADYNRAIAGCAERHAHVRLVDAHGAFLGHGIHSAQFWRPCYHADDPGYWLFANLEDPNDRGYDCIRRLLLLAMCEVFARAPARRRAGGALERTGSGCAGGRGQPGAPEGSRRLADPADRPPAPMGDRRHGCGRGS